MEVTPRAETKTFFGVEVPEEFQEGAERFCALARAAARFVTLDHELSTSKSPDPGVVVACLAARHDMQLLAGVPCGCSEDCPGVIG